MKLYEIDAELQALMSQIGVPPTEESGLTQERWDEAIFSAIEDMQTEFAIKIESIAKHVRNDLAESEKFATEARHFADKATMFKNRATRSKDFIKFVMEGRKIDKIEGEHLKVRLQNNPQKVGVLIESEIPDNYFIPQEPKLDKKSILVDLKAEKEVPGCVLEQTRSIRIS